MDNLQKINKDDEDLRHSLQTASYGNDGIIDIPTYCSPEPDHISVTAILQQCNVKVLKPYSRLLTLVGLQPVSFSYNTYSCWNITAHIYTVFIIILVLFGYILQYMSCFRRDRGFGYKEKPTTCFKLENYEAICHESFIFSHLIPHILHLSGYIYAIYIFRSSDDNKLQSLMERVFLFTANNRDGMLSQKKVVKVLRVFLILNIMWMAMSFVIVNIMVNESDIEFKWIDNKTWDALLLKILLIFCTVWHDAIQAIIISNYCLQAQLLILYLKFLRDKLLQHSIPTTEWMKEIAEFKKLLKFLNEEISSPVALFTIINLTWAFSGTFWALHFDLIDRQNLQTLGVNVLNVFLWVTLALAPFIQASRLTKVCENVRCIGHEVRTKPFVHQDTPDYKLDSILLFTSTLRMNAKLYRIPIYGKYLYAVVIVGSIFILVLGQLHYINTK